MIYTSAAGSHDDPATSSHAPSYRHAAHACLPCCSHHRLQEAPQDTHDKEQLYHQHERMQVKMISVQKLDHIYTSSFLSRRERDENKGFLLCIQKVNKGQRNDTDLICAWRE
ncbi:hypothetical protein ILYODFUR_028468 [Ilyodon furcidens]|uniref:Uncharacterized protein n=1 Tax=Ilyodon furcidens TaxID=33524 RepID=A0ABV0VIK4_9TELE